METVRNILKLIILKIGDYNITVSTLLIVILIFLVTKILLWIIKKTIFRKQTIERMQMSNAYSLFKIIKYILWIV